MGLPDRIQVLMAFAAFLLGCDGTPCELSAARRLGPASQRVALVGGSAGPLVLAVQSLPDGENRVRREARLFAPDGRAVPDPPLPVEFEAIRALAAADGAIRLFWTGRMRDEGAADDVSGGPSGLRGLSTLLWAGEGWSAPEPAFRASGVRDTNARGIVAEAEGRFHLATTAHAPGTNIPSLFHLVFHNGTWEASLLSRHAAHYPQLTAVGENELLVVSIGAVPGSDDVNSVWSTRFHRISGQREEAVLIHRSGRLASFEPTVHALASEVHAVWAADEDGRRDTREILWHARSADAGRTWSQPRVLAAGRHLWRPVLVSLGGERLAVVFLRSNGYGQPGELRVASLEDGRWTRSRTLLKAKASDFSVLEGPREGFHLALALYHPAPGMAEPGVYLLDATCARKGRPSG